MDWRVTDDRLRNGGPLVQVVTSEKAEWIREKETAIGMMWLADKF